MIETFSEEVKTLIYEAQNGYCAIDGCLEQIHSIHHKLHNTSYNRKSSPLFIHSVFNAIGLCFNCHKNNSHLFRITSKIAEVYENVMRNLKETNG